ncbi:MAG: nickel insertion protein, partial [Methanothrix sp.]
MKVFLFDPSAGASGDMIMASLLDLGADVDSVRKAVESVGCRLEVSRQEKSHIMACRAQVISDKRYQSLDEAKSILQGSSLSGKALEDAMTALDILADAEGRVHGVAAQRVRFHEIGALDALAD